MAAVAVGASLAPSFDEKTISQLVADLKLEDSSDIVYEQYEDESQLPRFKELIAKDLSEPYNIYTYRYFLHIWPELAWVAKDKKSGEIVGVVISKVDEKYEMNMETQIPSSTFQNQGYIGMLAIDDRYRRKGIATEMIIKL